MKNNKMKKTVIAASLFLVASATTLTNVEAQWSVIDVNSNSVKQTLEKSKELLDDIKAGVKGTIQELQGVRQGQEAQVKQVDQYQEDTDKRNRLSTGLADSLRRDLDAVPTIEQCAEMTARSGNSSAVSASLSGGGAGSRSTVGTKEYSQSKIVDNSTAQAVVLEGTRDSKTCAGGMDEAISGCSGVQTYAGGDVNSSSLKKNYASKDSNGIMDNSLNAEGIKAAEANARIATMYAAPPSLTSDQAKKNPAYVAIYKPVIAKLNASYEALMEVATVRKAPAAVISGVAGQAWNDTKADYKQTFGIDAPAIPSFFELLNFAVMKEFSGPPKKPEPENEKELLIEINKKMALSNVIAMQQYKAAETNNILLAHLLTQAVTPVNADNVRAEAAKTKNIK
jgi:hypothetical protein